MRRVMIVPAAGKGTRMASQGPKPLTLVNGRPMIDWIFDLYNDYVDRFILVVNPYHANSMEGHIAERDSKVEIVYQPAQTGMLDATLIPHKNVQDLRPDRVWITWCDQVAISSTTVARMSRAEREPPRPDLVLPSIMRREPYVHFRRNHAGKIVRVLHRREGDRMPESGESDMGLFSLSSSGYCEFLAQFAGTARPDRVTHERNFLPFVPWLSARSEVRTFGGCDERESVGVNTLEELRRVEEFLSRV